MCLNCVVFFKNQELIELKKNSLTGKNLYLTWLKDGLLEKKKLVQTNRPNKQMEMLFFLGHSA